MIGSFGISQWPGAVVLLLSICITLSSQMVGCGFDTVSIRVEPLTDEHFPAKPQDFQIDQWPTEPSRPHRKIAKLIGNAETEDEEVVRAALIKKAKSLGADAVIIQKIDNFEHRGGLHYLSTQSLGGYYPWLSGGMGFGFPMFYSPWMYAQSPSDAISWTVYMDVVAIRYGDSQGKELGQPRNLR